MKKLLLIALLFSMPAVAGEIKTFGARDPKPKMPVAMATDIESMDEDQKVLLQGYIVDQTDDDMYVFKDDSGTIPVEIDNDKWKGMTVTSDMKVEIVGEVDKGFKTKVEVKKIRPFDQKDGPDGPMGGPDGKKGDMPPPPAAK